jgi:hypothetical protein
MVYYNFKLGHKLAFISLMTIKEMIRNSNPEGMDSIFSKTFRQDLQDNQDFWYGFLMKPCNLHPPAGGKYYRNFFSIPMVNKIPIYAMVKK